MRWVEFERDEADLFARDFLHAYYRPETLASELARRVFVFPDGGSAGLSNRGLIDTAGGE